MEIQKKNIGDILSSLNFHEEIGDHWASIIVVSEGEEDVWKPRTVFLNHPTKNNPSKPCHPGHVPSGNVYKKLLKWPLK